MPKLEVFYDYSCPYCMKGHRYLLELLPKFPGLEVEWRPCEAHPRPETHTPHSDLCARAMYFAQEQGADVMLYHDRMYDTAYTKRANVDDPGVVSEALKGLLDGGALQKALSDGLYEDKLLENNDLAWETYDFPAIPSYRMNGKSLKSIPGVGVTKEELEAFIKGGI